MPWVEKSRVVKKGWLFDEKEYYYEEVKVLGQETFTNVDGHKWNEYLVEDKEGKKFTVRHIYN